MAMAIENRSSAAASPTSASMMGPILLALLSAFLLNLPFPIAGPLPPWRAAFGWIALAPLLTAVLAKKGAAQTKYLRRSALTGYICGIGWYTLNCYWIYRTMNLYGHVPPLGAAGMLLLYSLVLGLYFGLFGLLLAFVRKASGGIILPLIVAPFAWVGIELLASRITSVPWDQLGYSQVDNFLLTRLAPYTGVYGISFILIAVNALFAAALLSRSIHLRLRIGIGAALLAVLLQIGSWMPPASAPVSATAVLLQPNFSVDENNDWAGPLWDQNIGRFLHQSESLSGTWYDGMPDPDKTARITNLAGHVPPITLIAWPEAPSPFYEGDPRFLAAMHQLAQETHAGIIVGNPSADWSVNAEGQQVVKQYNSATVFSPEGNRIGRYDKIHLVPFGEFVPYSEMFFFAKKLTRQAGNFSRGTERRVFTLNGHRYGIFICYESIFADEIREFAKNGAEALVNISDDGWYGDTSAPWQHLNMARMRAIENRRWLLRDTNTGVTTVIDPYGRVLKSAPRGIFTSLAVQYGFRDDVTFYTRYGDVFAWLCGIITIGAVLYFANARSRSQQ
jgi:apolipoprotein N-acyltransferase